MIFKLFAVIYLSFCIAFLLTSPTNAYFQDVESFAVAISTAVDFTEDTAESEKASNDEADKSPTSNTEVQDEQEQTTEQGKVQ